MRGARNHVSQRASTLIQDMMLVFGLVYRILCDVITHWTTIPSSYTSCPQTVMATHGRNLPTAEFDLSGNTAGCQS